MSCCNQHTYFDQFKTAGAKKALFNNTAFYKQIQAYTNKPQVYEGFQMGAPADQFSTQAAFATPPSQPEVVALATAAGKSINALTPNNFAGPIGSAAFAQAAQGQVVKYAQGYPTIDMHPGAKNMMSIGGYQLQDSAYSADTQAVYVTGSCTM